MQRIVLQFQADEKGPLACPWIQSQKYETGLSTVKRHFLLKRDQRNVLPKGMYSKKSVGLLAGVLYDSLK